MEMNYYYYDKTREPFTKKAAFAPLCGTERWTVPRI